jgi:phosphoribosylglycinamide formyltransferase 1
MSLRLAVFTSGGGSNLQALIDRFNTAADSPVKVSLVLADRDNAGALERARRASIETCVVTGPDEMLAVLERARIDMIALAGYIQLVPADVVRYYSRRIVNIHPALLPAFGGKGMYGARVHKAVLESGCKVSGATVHYVTEHYDEGDIIAQWPVPVVPDDTPESLAARVLEAEHLLYPIVVEVIARQLARTHTE